MTERDIHTTPGTPHGHGRGMRPPKKANESVRDVLAHREMQQMLVEMNAMAHALSRRSNASMEAVHITNEFFAAINRWSALVQSDLAREQSPERKAFVEAAMGMGAYLAEVAPKQTRAGMEHHGSLLLAAYRALVEKERTDG